MVAEHDNLARLLTDVPVAENRESAAALLKTGKAAVMYRIEERTYAVLDTNAVRNMPWVGVPDFKQRYYRGKYLMDVYEATENKPCIIAKIISNGEFLDVAILTGQEAGAVQKTLSNKLFELFGNRTHVYRDFTTPVAEMTQKEKTAALLGVRY